MMLFIINNLSYHEKFNIMWDLSTKQLIKNETRESVSFSFVLSVLYIEVNESIVSDPKLLCHISIKYISEYFMNHSNF